MQGKKIWVGLAVSLLCLTAQAEDKGISGPSLEQGRTYIPVGLMDKTLVPSSGVGMASNEALGCEYGFDYKPLAAFDAPNYTKVTLRPNKKVLWSPQKWPSTNKEKNALLPNIATNVKIVDVKASAKIGGVFSADGQGKQIIIDFMKYRTEPVIESGNDKLLMYSRVGAGMRLEINMTTVDAGLDANLFAIAASAKAGKTVGSISVDVIGMNAADVTLSMPFTSDLSEGSIQKIIEALAIVKSKLHDKNTTLSPQFIARVQCKPEPDEKKPGAESE